MHLSRISRFARFLRYMYWCLSGMHLADVKAVGKFMQTTKSLHSLILRENLLNHESIQTLMIGLMSNDTLTHLDLSHNKVCA